MLKKLLLGAVCLGITGGMCLFLDASDKALSGAHAIFGDVSSVVLTKEEGVATSEASVKGKTTAHQEFAEPKKIEQIQPVVDVHQKKYVLSLHGIKVSISPQGFLLSKQFKEFEDEYGDDEQYFDVRNSTLTMPLDDLFVGRPWTIRDVKAFIELAHGTLKWGEKSAVQLLSLLQLAHYLGAHIFDAGYRPSRDLVDELLNELATRIRDRDFVDWLNGSGVLWNVLELNDDLLDQLAHKMFYELLDTPPLLRTLSESQGNYFVLSQGMIAHVDAFQEGKKTSITFIDPRTGVTRWQFKCDGHVIGVQSLSGERLAVVTTDQEKALQIIDMKHDGKLLQTYPIKMSLQDQLEFIGLIELDNGALVVAVSGQSLFILNPHASELVQRTISLPSDSYGSDVHHICAVSQGRFVTTSFSGDIKLWDVKHKRPVLIYKGQSFSLIGIIAVSGDQVAFRTLDDQQVLLLDVRKGVITNLSDKNLGKLFDFVFFT